MIRLEFDPLFQRWLRWRMVRRLRRFGRAHEKLAASLEAATCAMRLFAEAARIE